MKDGLPGTLAAGLIIAGKDLRSELRRRTALVSAVVFAALILVIFNFARDPTALRAEQLAPSAFWITCAFAAVTALSRAFAVELEHGALDGLLLAPVPREALFVGKFLGNLTFVLVVESIALPLFVLFFNVSLKGALPGIMLVSLLATVGFVAVGTVFSAMVARTRFAELMLPVLLLPFMVPPLILAVKITVPLLAGRPLSEVTDGLRFLAIFDVVFVTLSVMLFSAVVDE